MQDTTSSARYAPSTLDAVSFGLVLLDKTGVILSANKSWRDAFPDRGYERSKHGEGANYLSVCDQASGPNAGGAREMAAGIRAVLGGSKQKFALEYPCNAQWFMGGVMRFEQDGEVRAVVTQLDISVRRAMEVKALRDSEEMVKRAAELVLANIELAYQNEEKNKRAAELALANIELAYQNGEKSKRAAELLIARDAAQSASLAKSSFLANMSHEIRTPLGAIYGMANLIAKEPLTATQTDRMGKLQTAFKHLSGTINGILDFSKIEANKLVLEEGPVRIDQLMANVAAMVQGSAHDKGLDLHLHTEAMPPHLLGDSTRLAQALLNYAANAVKFTDAGSIRLSAFVVEDGADTSPVRMEVKDTGMGISAPMLPKLFEPFVQTDSSTSRTHGMGWRPVGRYALQQPVLQSTLLR